MLGEKDKRVKRGMTGVFKNLGKKMYQKIV
jgi:hypothetical protein